MRLRSSWDIRAAGLMLGSAALASLLPVVLLFTGAVVAPFLFTACLQVGGLVGYALLLRSRYWDVLSTAGMFHILRRHFSLNRLSGWLLIMGGLSGFDYALFIYAARVIDVGVVAVLFELWPLFSIPLISAFSNRVYSKFTVKMMILVSGGFLGVVLVICSQTGRFWGSPDLSVGDWFIGFGLALGSAAAVSLSVALFRWSENVVFELPTVVRDSWGQFDLELYGLSLAIIVTGLFSVSVNVALGWISGERIGWLTVAYGLVFGCLLNFLGSLTWRLANLLTANLGINALTYLSPLLAIVWLALYVILKLPGSSGVLDVARFDYLVIGAFLVVLCNVFIGLSRGRG